MEYFLKGFKNYANFEGTASKREFFTFLIPNIIIILIFELLGRNVFYIATVGSLYRLFVLMPLLGVGIRRMHDIGKSGWYILIPIYNLILFFRNSNTDNNSFIIKQTNENNYPSLKIPWWLIILNGISLLWILLSLFLFPFSFSFAFMLLFSESHNIIFAMGRLLLLLGYPFILIGGNILSFKLYKRRHKIISIIIPLIILGLSLFTIYTIRK